MRAIELPVERSARRAPRRSFDLPELDREFAAVVLDWAAAGVHDRPAATALRRRIEALCAASVQVAVVSDVEFLGVDTRLRARPNGPGRLLVATVPSGSLHTISAGGPALLRHYPPTKESAMTAILGEFAAAGIGPGLVLVVGDDFGRDGGQLLGPGREARSRAVGGVRNQRTRRPRCRCSAVAPSCSAPSWTAFWPGGPRDGCPPSTRTRSGCSGRPRRRAPPAQRRERAHHRLRRRSARAARWRSRPEARCRSPSPRVCTPAPAPSNTCCPGRAGPRCTLRRRRTRTSGSSTCAPACWCGPNEAMTMCRCARRGSPARPPRA